MIKTEIIKQDIEIVNDVICDCCGMSCKISDLDKNFEFMTMTTKWGYYSSKDTEEWIAHICEPCIDEKFKFVKFTKTPYDIC